MEGMFRCDELRLESIGVFGKTREGTHESHANSYRSGSEPTLCVLIWALHPNPRASHASNMWLQLLLTLPRSSIAAGVGTSSIDLPTNFLTSSSLVGRGYNEAASMIG